METKDLKIQFGLAQEVDFTEFLNNIDQEGNSMGEYVEVAKGNVNGTFVEEYCKNTNSEKEIIEMAKDYLWRCAIDFAQYKLHGWGGREQSAYCTEFFKRVGVTFKMN